MLICVKDSAPTAAPTSFLCEADRHAEATRFLKLLDHARLVVRTLPDSRELYGEWSNVEDFALSVVRLSKPPGEPTAANGVYVIINPATEEDFFKFANGHGDGKAVADRHIERRTMFYVDIDPKRSDAAGGKVCATNAEREWAEAAMETVLMVAAAHGFSEPLAVDSGNGYQIHFRVDLPNDDESKALIKSVLEAFAAIVDCERGHIDTSVCNAARLARLPGTFNRKGEHSPERPYRLSRIVIAPDDGILLVTDATALRAFAVLHAGTMNNGAALKSANQAPSRGDIDSCTFDTLVDEVRVYLAKNGAPEIVNVTNSDRKTVLSLAHCPFRGPAHTDGDPGVLVWKSGSVGFKCFHDHCSDHDWSSLQKKLGPRFHSDALVEFAAAHSDEVFRSYRDPYFLANVYLEKSCLPDGGPSLKYIGGQMFRYLPDAGWREVQNGDLHAPVRATMQSVYDAQYITNPVSKHAPIVLPNQVNSTVKALESVAHFATDPAQAPPFWLSDEYDSDPLNLLVLKNGIIDVMAHANGESCYFPSTSQLFTHAIGAYDYDPEQREAPHWFGFLDTLGQDDKWIALLQQIMGCSLCGGYDLQKIFMMVGPPRCGKGTITRVLENLLGIQNVCSPNLIDFAKPFGLEQTMGTRLAIVPEVAFPPKDTPQIVAVLKAISGGDMVTVDRKHIKNIPVRLRMKILLVTNNFVALPDNSKALPSRIVPIRFTTSFLGKEDLALGKRLMTEQSAILNWAMDGFRQLVSQGGQFTLPDSSLELMEQLQVESAPLQSFIQDACALDPRKGVYKVSLYERYKAWKKDHDSESPVLSTGDFNRELQTAASQLTSKRASNRDHKQAGYTIVPTPFDAKSDATRPEAWVGIYCRADH